MIKRLLDALCRWLERHADRAENEFWPEMEQFCRSQDVKVRGPAIRELRRRERLG